MKRLLLILALTLPMAAVCFAKSTPVDKVPYPQYFTDIQFDVNTGKLSFDDTYKADEYVDRRYIVHFYYRAAYTALMYYDSYDGRFYSYSNKYYYDGLDAEIFDVQKNEGEEDTYTKIEKRFSMPHSTGGKREFDLSDAIALCLKSRHGQLRIAIEGLDVKKDDSYTPFEYADGKQSPLRGSFLNNYIDVNVGGFSKLELSGSDYVIAGTDMFMSLAVQGVGTTKYVLQYSADKLIWIIADKGEISSGHVTAEYIQPTPLVVSILDISVPSPVYFRAVVCDVASDYKDTTDILEMKVQYTWNDGKKDMHYAPGEKVSYPLPDDCTDYILTSDLPVEQALESDNIVFTMPACNVKFDVVPFKFTVRFLNADYTLLKSEEVVCGGDATAPANPEMQGMNFKKWSRDFTDVRDNISVIAQYEMASDYVFTTRMTSHTNDRLIAQGFADATDKAMAGDRITFAVDIQTPATSTVYIENGMYDANGNVIWNGGEQIGSASAGQLETFTKTVDVAWNIFSANENAWQHKLAYRFYFYSAGTKIYSEPYEFDVYYRLDIRSQITAGDAKVPVFVGNTCGTSFSVAARYGDTVRVELENGVGGCMTFERVNQPSRTLEDGLDDEGTTYFVCPGESEIINVAVSRKLVVFDGVYGNSYPKQLDFSAQGFGKFNGYYGEIVNCGGTVTGLEDSSMEGYLFTGWQAWNTDYADDDYLHVPATDDNVIGFTAQWEEIIVPQYYVVVFQNWDGNPINVQQVEEGKAAIAPVVERDGYEFAYWRDDATGLEADFSNITADMTVTAVYIIAENLEEVVSNLHENFNQPQKVIYNGTIFIVLPNSKVFNAQGQELNRE